MSNEKNQEVVQKKQDDSIRPIPWEKRTMNWGSNTMLWLGGCISIGTLAMGSAQMETGLNLLQLFLAMLIGSTILVIGIAMNDQFGYTTGAPYSVHLKSAYGTKGNILPSMLRGLPAIVWYGYQTWLGGAAINNIVKLIFGYDNIWLWFIVFQVVQILLSIKGFQGAKWVGNIGGTVIVFAMIYLLYICLTTQWDVISTNLMNKSGTWPFVCCCNHRILWKQYNRNAERFGLLQRDEAGLQRTGKRILLLHGNGTGYCNAGNHRCNGFHCNRYCKPD